MRVRVLLVDDDRAILQTLSAILQMEDAEVITADCARSAIEQLSGENFDLVITDMRMETPNAGIDVVQAAAVLEPRPLIMILTAFPIPDADARGAGASSVMLKSSDPFTTVKQLRNVVRAAAVAKKPPASAPSVEPGVQQKSPR